MQVSQSLIQTKNISREEALQKIIKKQELTISELESRLNDKISPAMQVKLKYETELNRKNKEIELLNQKLQEDNHRYQEERSEYRLLNDELQKALENMKIAFTKENHDNEKRILIMEENYKQQVIALENEKKKYTDELNNLKNIININHKYRQQLDHDSRYFDKIMQDFQKVYEIFNQQEREYKKQIDLLKKELEDNLTSYNGHLSTCSIERRKASKASLDDIVVNIEKSNMGYNDKLDECIENLKLVLGDRDTRQVELKNFEKQIENSNKTIEEYRNEYMKIDEMEKNYIQKYLENMKDDIETRSNKKIKELEYLIHERDDLIKSLKEEITILKNENGILLSNIEEFKTLSTRREKNLINEIQALKLNNEKLIGISEKRESIIQEEINLHREEVAKLKVIYEQRENLYLQESKQFLESVESLHNEIQNFAQKQIHSARMTVTMTKTSNGPSRSSSPMKLYTPHGGGGGLGASGGGLGASGGGGKEQQAVSIAEKIAREVNPVVSQHLREESQDMLSIQKHRDELDNLNNFGIRLLKGIQLLNDRLLTMQNSIKEYIDCVGKINTINSSNMNDLLNITYIDELKGIFTKVIRDKNKIEIEYELEKYKKKIIEQDNELELAKYAIIHYKEINHVLENMLNSLTHKNTIDNTLIENPNKEHEILKMEYMKLKEELVMITKNKKILEDYQEKQIEKITNMLNNQATMQVKLDEKIVYIINTLNEIKANIDHYNNTIIQAKEQNHVKKFQNKLIVESIEAFNNTLSEIQPILQSLIDSKSKLPSDNIGGSDFTGGILPNTSNTADKTSMMTGSNTNSMPGESKYPIGNIHNERIAQYEKHIGLMQGQVQKLEKDLQEERSLMQGHLIKLNEIENNPIKVYEELNSIIKKEGDVLQSLKGKLDHLESSQQAMIQNSFNITLDMKHNNEIFIPAHVQESYTALKAELYILKEETIQENLIFQQELQNLKKNHEDALSILQTKLEGSQKLIDDLEGLLKLTKGQMKALIDQGEHDKEAIRAEFGLKAKLQNEKMNLLKNENNKLRQEIKELKDQVNQNQVNDNSRLAKCLQALESLQERQEKFFNEKKTYIMSELTKREKLDEKVIKENFEYHELLKNQIENLKNDLQKVEQMRVKENNSLLSFIEDMKVGFNALKARFLEESHLVEEQSKFLKDNPIVGKA